MNSHFLERCEITWHYLINLILYRSVTNDQDLKKFGQVVKSTEKLQVLRINCWNCQNITHHGLDYFCESLKTQRFLQKVGLSFPNCSQLTDKALQNLSEGLMRLPFLKDLFLNFTECSKVTEEGFFFLSQSFQRLKSLNSLYISLLGWVPSTVFESFWLSLETFKSKMRDQNTFSKA